jgi:hypothetical protein
MLPDMGSLVANFHEQHGISPRPKILYSGRVDLELVAKHDCQIPQLRLFQRRYRKGRSLLE